MPSLYRPSTDGLIDGSTGCVPLSPSSAGGSEGCVPLSLSSTGGSEGCVPLFPSSAGGFWGRPSPFIIPSFFFFHIFGLSGFCFALCSGCNRNTVKNRLSSAADPFTHFVAVFEIHFFNQSKTPAPLILPAISVSLLNAEEPLH